MFQSQHHHHHLLQVLAKCTSLLLYFYDSYTCVGSLVGACRKVFVERTSIAAKVASEAEAY